MKIYGYRSPRGDNRLFLSTTKPVMIKGYPDSESVETDFGHVGWIDDAAKKMGLKPGEFTTITLKPGTPKKINVEKD